MSKMITAEITRKNKNYHAPIHQFDEKFIQDNIPQIEMTINYSRVLRTVGYNIETINIDKFSHKEKCLLLTTLLNYSFANKLYHKECDELIDFLRTCIHYDYHICIA